MIDYPQCDNDECWYRGNEDRINGSDSVSFWINNEENAQYNTSGEDGMLVLCDVCSAHQDVHATCALCNVQMIDAYIYHAGRHYCSRCIKRKRVVKFIGADRRAGVDVEEWIREMRDETKKRVDRCFLPELIDEATLRHNYKRERNEKRKRVEQARNGQYLCQWLPSLADEGHEQMERVVKKLKHDLPEFTSASSLLCYLIELEPS